MGTVIFNTVDWSHLRSVTGLLAVPLCVLYHTPLYTEIQKNNHDYEQYITVEPLILYIALLRTFVNVFLMHNKVSGIPH